MKFIPNCAFLFLLVSTSIWASNDLQVKPLLVNQTLLNKILKIEADSSNANTLDKLLGPASACLPMSNETWVCQWKGNLSSNRIENTLNITFEAGMIAKVIGVDKKGVFLKP